MIRWQIPPNIIIHVDIMNRHIFIYSSFIHRTGSKKINKYIRLMKLNNKKNLTIFFALKSPSETKPAAVVCLFLFIDSLVFCKNSLRASLTFLWIQMEQIVSGRLVDSKNLWNHLIGGIRSFIINFFIRINYNTIQYNIHLMRLDRTQAIQ